MHNISWTVHQHMTLDQTDASTDKIVGQEVGISNLDTVIKERDVKFENDNDNEWLIGEEAIYQGLAWSLKQLSE